jgi:hypothetical protein
MQPIRFLHIPKTAGETFSAILEKVYAEFPDFFFTGDFPADRDRYRLLPEAEKQQIRLFHGHAPLTTGLAEIDALPVVTLLREPIGRVKSFCQHVSEGKSPHLVKGFPPDNFDLDAFLASGDYELSNLQTKFLISTGNLEEIADPATAAERALDCLFNRVAGFGLTEYFAESLAGLARQFAWPVPRYKRLNCKNTRRLLHFERRHLERIAELNRLDLEVYRAARQRFVHSAQAVRGIWGWRLASLGWATTEAFVASTALVKGKSLQPLAWLRRSFRHRLVRG